MASVYHPVRRLAALCTLIGLAAVTATPAASAATREEQSAACKGDALKLCTFYIPNEQKIAACLQAKRDKLSPACKTFFPEKKSSKGRKPSKQRTS